MPQRPTHNGRLTKGVNTMVITCRTKQIMHLPQSHRPVRPSNRRQEIYISQILDWRFQSHDLPISLPPPTNYPSKSWEKYLAYLQSTYNLSRSLALPASQLLCPWLPLATTTGWVLLKYQDRVLHLSPKGWSSYIPLISCQVRSIHQ